MKAQVEKRWFRSFSLALPAFGSCRDGNCVRSSTELIQWAETSASTLSADRKCERRGRRSGTTKKTLFNIHSWQSLDLSYIFLAAPRVGDFAKHPSSIGCERWFLLLSFTKFSISEIWRDCHAWRTQPKALSDELNSNFRCEQSIFRSEENDYPSRFYCFCSIFVFPPPLHNSSLNLFRNCGNRAESWTASAQQLHSTVCSLVASFIYSGLRDFACSEFFSPSPSSGKQTNRTKKKTIRIMETKSFG